MTTMTEALRLYRAGNNAGMGYAPYADEAADDTIESAIACAEADGWEVTLQRTNSEEVAVLTDADGGVMAIGGDAMGCSAWAVVIVESVTIGQVRALRSEAAVAGDESQVRICDRAIKGDREALGECGRVIAAATAASS